MMYMYKEILLTDHNFVFMNSNAVFVWEVKNTNIMRLNAKLIAALVTWIDFLNCIRQLECFR